MAKAGAEDTATWDTLQDALARLGEVFASPDYAREWLLTRIIDRRIRQRSIDEAPASFWTGSWRDFEVRGSDVSKGGEFLHVPRKATDAGLAGDALGFGPRVTVRGVFVAREGIARECPEYGAAPAPGKPVSTVKRGESTKRRALRYVADTYYPNGKPQRLTWSSFTDNHIVRLWPEACGTLDVAPSRYPTQPSSKMVASFFRERSARG
jgi:hypothetical protein